jgi:hypothetical protein
MSATYRQDFLYSNAQDFWKAIKQEPITWKDIENHATLVLIGCLPPPVLRPIQLFAFEVEKISEQEEGGTPNGQEKAFYFLAKKGPHNGYIFSTPEEKIISAFDGAIYALSSAISSRSNLDKEFALDLCREKSERVRLAGLLILLYAFQKFSIPDFGG